MSDHDADDADPPFLSSTRGRLLVATPPLEDPNFDRTVVFMLEHTVDGAVGVVINRPLPDELPDPIDRWTPWLSPPARVFEGGPVQTDALIALGDVDDTPANTQWSMVAAGLRSVDLAEDPALLSEGVRALRVFRGYAGWGPGQLDAEIDGGAWLVLAAERSDVFVMQPRGLWRDVLRRQGGRTAWLADAPDDLQMN